jgi:hypothetical protein
VARAFRVGVGDREKGAPKGAKLQARVANSHKANNSPSTLRRGSLRLGSGQAGWALIGTGPFIFTFGENLEAKGSLLFFSEGAGPAPLAYLRENLPIRSVHHLGDEEGNGPQGQEGAEGQQTLAAHLAQKNPDQSHQSRTAQANEEGPI